jgi:hypothetical protein
LAFEWLDGQMAQMDNQDNQHDHTQAAPPREAEGMMAIVVLGLALLLLAMAPFVTRAQPADKPWFMAPVLGPVLSLLIMAVPAAVLAWNWLAGYRAANPVAGYLQKSSWAFGDFRSAAEYGAYFCIYMWSITRIGFAVSTLVFGQLCLYRSGLRSRGWVLANLAFVGVLVVLLRVVLGLWFPMAPVFKLLPPGIGNFLGTYL